MGMILEAAESGKGSFSRDSGRFLEFRDTSVRLSTN